MGEKGEVTKTNDFGPFFRVAFGENSGFGNHYGAGFTHELSETGKGGTGGDNVVNQGDFFSLEGQAVFTVKPESLGLAGGDADNLMVEAVDHVGFFDFAGNDVGDFQLFGEFVGKGNAFNFRGNQAIEVVWEATGEGAGGFGNEDGVAKDIEDGDFEVGSDGEKGEGAGEAAKVQAVILFFWHLTKTGVIKRMAARAGAIFRPGGNHIENEFPGGGYGGIKIVDNLSGGNWFEFGLENEAGVIIGDDGNGGVAKGKFLGEDNFRILGHVHDIPIHLGKPGGFGGSGEAGTVNDNGSTTGMNWKVKTFGMFESVLAKTGAIGKSGGNVGDDGAVVVGISAVFSAIDELVKDDKVAGLKMGLE